MHSRALARLDRGLGEIPFQPLNLGRDSTCAKTKTIFYPSTWREQLIVLVIGGAGYIGSHAARTLRRRGHEVVIYDNLSTGYAFLASGFELVRGDIADRTTLSAALRRVDSVMHFAAYASVGESVENPRKYFRNNVEGGLVLLNACVDCGVRRIIFSSTCAVY